MLSSRSPSPRPASYPPSNGAADMRDPPLPEKDETAVPPINWLLILPILLFRVADAMSYTIIFPYITEMITGFGVPADRIGLYAGMGEGAIMLVEAVAATTWARVADRYGRRRALLCGFLATVGTAPIVGFASGPWHVIFWRGMFGLNPCGALVKILASELTHPKNRAKVFSVFSPSFYIGIMLGTFLGGHLARPYGRLPWWLGGTADIWRRWPYALPSVVVAVFGLAVITIGYFYLPETRPPRARDENGSPETQKSNGGIMTCLKVPGFALAIFVFCFFEIATMSWDGIFTVLTYTPVARGRLGLAVPTIGTLFSLSAIAYIIVTPLALPRIERRLGGVRALRYIFGVWPLIALLIPLAQWAARRLRPAMWAVLAGQLVAKNAGNLAWPMCDVIIMGTFDEYPELLATGAAISLIAGALGRALGPMTASWIYSISTQFPQGSLGRQLSWITMLTIALPPVILVRFLRDGAKKPQNDGYEAVPLTEAGQDDGWGEREVQHSTELADNEGWKDGKMSAGVHEAV